MGADGGGGVVAVLLEQGGRRTFAAALDWPGWCRSARTEIEALAALRAYAPRYAAVPRLAGVAFAAGQALSVVERVPGTASTEFGVPDARAGTDAEGLPPAQAERLAALVDASWRLLDQVAAGAPPGLRRGPRGGGRDRDPIVDHVLAADVAYARRLGLRLAQPVRGDRPAVEAFRQQVLAVLRAGSPGGAPEPGRWPLRYAARRIAWHAVDHAWEIEDRSAPG